MLRPAKEFKEFKLRARDGDIGEAMEFYFDDQHWTVRYLLADTGGWLIGRQVLISPHALHPVNETDHVLPVELTKKQLEESPSLDSDKPVSRQYEVQYHAYYSWPLYWNGPYLWGSSLYPIGQSGGVTWASENGIPPVELSSPPAETGDPNLRSTGAVTGYHISCLDGEIGHVEDFIIDDETWAIRYLVVDTQNWWAGKHVLVSPRWIERISWDESKVFVKLSSDMVKNSPEYTPETLNRDYETSLHGHYNQQGYWVDSRPANTQ
ncbi:MAG: PRC-barrel domain-containing protein [Verrucomicrobiota bacterium]|nr:PRC-barrel domain-containing protein [Verrucomicrobiota bacterium]